jgi:hypothetical protein
MYKIKCINDKYVQWQMTITSIFVSVSHSILDNDITFFPLKNVVVASHKHISPSKFDDYSNMIRKIIGKLQNLCDGVEYTPCISPVLTQFCIKIDLSFTEYKFLVRPKSRISNDSFFRFPIQLIFDKSLYFLMKPVVFFINFWQCRPITIYMVFTQRLILPLHLRHFITWSLRTPAFIIPFTMYFSQIPILELIYE